MLKQLISSRLWFLNHWHFSHMLLLKINIGSNKTVVMELNHIQLFVHGPSVIDKEKRNLDTRKWLKPQIVCWRAAFLSKRVNLSQFWLAWLAHHGLMKIQNVSQHNLTHFFSQLKKHNLALPTRGGGLGLVGSPRF